MTVPSSASVFRAGIQSGAHMTKAGAREDKPVYLPCMGESRWWHSRVKVKEPAGLIKGRPDGRFTGPPSYRVG